MFGRPDQDIPIADPRFDLYVTVGEFGDAPSARSFRDHLVQLGFDAHAVADRSLDRHGRGHIFLVVAPDQASDAEQILGHPGE